ncbi:MAG: hypothetical protein RIT43_892 [Bacteroidota bacterium]
MCKNVLFFFVLCVSTVGFSQPTWSGDVAKIMYGNCTSCHRTGGIAPFALETYEEVSNMAGWLQQAMDDKRMPPWTPDPNYKSFVHQRVMDPADMSTFQQWVAAGMPSGNLNVAPPLPVYSNGSQIGTPDLSLTIPTYTVTSGNDVYRNFELIVGNTSATNATAIEVVPGNPAIVHHVLVFQDSTNNPINPASAGGTGSTASQLLYGYVPGASPYFTPVGTGFRLAPNTRIILQVHYAPGSNGLSDATTVNFKTDNAPLRKISVSAVLNHSNMTNGPLSIPANQVKTFNSEQLLPNKFTTLFAFPHMHLLGKSFKVWANAPLTGDTTRIVWIPKWDFHWQDNFIFPNVMVMPTGTTLRAEAVYDNTTLNPNNPTSPPQNVTAGESTNDEMFLVFFGYMPFVAGDQNLIVDKRVFAKGATTFCNGHTVRLETIQGVGYTYQWLKDGVAIPGETNWYMEAGVTGAYTVSITLGPNNAVSDPVNVVVNAAPTAQIQTPASTVIPSGGTISLSAVTTVGAQYQWYLNGNAIAGATGSTYDAANFGAYTVEVFNGTCYALSDPLVMTGGVAGLSDVETFGLTMVPNPASNVVELSGSMVQKAAMAEIFDMNGKLVSSHSLSGSLTHSLSTNHLNEGTYILSLINGDKEVLLRKRFVIAR